MILDFILFALGFYFVYKVIFELIIPLFRTTRTIRRQFSNMQDQMNAHQNGTPNQPGPSTATPQKKPVKAGDYIDFEEVK